MKLFHVKKWYNYELLLWKQQDIPSTINVYSIMILFSLMIWTIHKIDLKHISNTTEIYDGHVK